mgnify:CR=1 FL=1
MIRKAAFTIAKPSSALMMFEGMPNKAFSTARDLGILMTVGSKTRRTIYALRHDTLDKFKYYAFSNFFEGALWFSATGFTFWMLPFPWSICGLIPASLCLKSLMAGTSDYLSHIQLNRKEICHKITVIDNNRLLFTNADGVQYVADYDYDHLTLEGADWNQIYRQYHRGTLRFYFAKMNIKNPLTKTTTYSGYLLFDIQHSAIGNLEIIDDVFNKNVENLMETVAPSEIVEGEKRSLTYTNKTVYRRCQYSTENKMASGLPMRLLSGGCWTAASAALFSLGHGYLACFAYWFAVSEFGFGSNQLLKEQFKFNKICNEIKILDNDNVLLIFQNGQQAITHIAALEILYDDRWNEAKKFFLEEEAPEEEFPIKCSYLNEEGKTEDFDIYLNYEKTEIENLALLETILKGQTREFWDFEYRS